MSASRLEPILSNQPGREARHPAEVTNRHASPGPGRRQRLPARAIAGSLGPAPRGAAATIRHMSAPAASSPPTLATWEFAGLMLTYWCNSRCAFCYVNAGPEHSGSMDVATALRLWRELDDLARAHGKAMKVHLAGGEPCGDWVRLVSLLRAARDAGLPPAEKVETNAFWATNDGLTRARLELLDALGVERLIISADVFHQEYVPFERVERCVRVARRVFGLGRLIVRWWDFFQKPVEVGGLADDEKRAAFRAALLHHPDRLTGRAARVLAPLLPAQPPETFRDQNCVGEVLQSRHVHIDRYGNIFPGTCGGIILGQASVATSVADVWQHLADEWPRHPVVAAVVAGGSYTLMERALPLGYQPLPGYASKCHLCAHVREFLFARGLWPEQVGPAECYAPPSCHPGPDAGATSSACSRPGP